MSSKKIRGIQVEIGGNTTKLGDAIADSEKHTRSLQNELKEVDRLLKFDPGNTDLLAQRQKILSEAVEETTDKLKKLKDAEKQVVEQFNRGDIGEDQLRAFQREIMDTENKLDGFQAELKDTKGDIKDVGDSAENSSDGFTIMKGALADLVSSAISSAVSAIGDLVGALFELSEATEEYRTMQAKLEGSANTFGYSADFAKSKYEEFYKYLGDDQMATNAITNLMGLGTSTESVSKLAEGATAVWASYGDSIPIESLTESINETVNAGKVTGTFADTINWCKDANTQLNKALGGNKKAQKAYNDAIKEGMTAEDAFNEALAKVTDEQERADIVAKFLNNTYGESKKAYDELNGSVIDANEAELELKETQAELGETMAPVNNAISEMKNKALEAITPLVVKLADAFMDLYNWLKEHPTAMKILTGVVIALATAFTILAGVLAIQGIINGVSKAFAFLNTTMLANPIVLIIALIAGLVAGFMYLWKNCESFRNFWKNMWNGIKSAFSKVVAWFKETAPKIAQFFRDAWTSIKNTWSKVTAFFRNIWTGIKNTFSNVKSWFGEKFRSALSAVKSAWSGTKKFFSGIWSGIKSVFSSVRSWFGNIFRSAWSAIKSAWSSVKSFFRNIWSGIKNVFSSVGSWFRQKFTSAKNSIVNAFSNIKSKFSEIWRKIKSAFNVKEMLSIGKDIVSGLWDGITNKVSWLKKKIKGFVGDVTGWLKKFFKIESPSRIMRDEIGKYIAEGIGVGITENEDKPLEALNKLGNDMLNTEFDVNGATVNRQLTNAINGGGLNSSVLSKLDGIYERLNHLQIVLDSGTLVGETIDKIDMALADRQLLTARGV